MKTVSLPLKIDENFLSYIWKHQLIQTTELRRHNLQILNPGILNKNAGPDFFNAKVKLDNITWSGNIELHVKSSDWKKHKHTDNPAYNNIILHVVYEKDVPLPELDQKDVPTLELKPLISSWVWERYYDLYHNIKKKWIPCERLLGKKHSFNTSNFINRLATERLERKSMEIFETLNYVRGDWNQTILICLFKSFGLKVNSLAFELLAKSISFSIIERIGNNPIELESLLFGQSGLLDQMEAPDSYTTHLKNQYNFLSKKFKISPINPVAFKFSKVRPINFPTIKIALLAQILSNRKRSLLTDLIYEKSYENLYNFFNLQASTYWDTHYLLTKNSTLREKKLGKESIHLILINFLIPFKFAYGSRLGIDSIKADSLELFEQVKAEDNSITKRWKQHNIIAKNALESQALIELKNNYCSQKKCLNCAIGTKILKNEV